MAVVVNTGVTYAQSTAAPWRASVPEPYTGGDASQVTASLSSITVAGQQVEVPLGGVTAVVGANNAGKSTLLREVAARLALDTNIEVPSVLVGGLALQRGGSGADLVEWLGGRLPWLPNLGGQPGWQFPQGVLGPATAAQQWEHYLPHNRLGPYLAGAFVHSVAGDQRTIGVSPAAVRGDLGEPATHPLHHLQDDPALLAEVQRYAERVFRVQLTLDRVSGHVQLRVGRTTVPAPPVDAVTAEYRLDLARLPRLHEQGDGMRAFLSLLLPLVTGSHCIVIVDEPEAFLHPPQAAALGRILGELARDRGLQVLLATHDRDLLAGVLASEAPVTVVRLSRAAAGTTVHPLPAERLRALWNDPVTRYSRVLDGLFHRLVVLAENERDCRFYAAALDAADDKGVTGDLAPTDVLFLPAGGKSGLAVLAETLRTVAVPVVATADLDVIDDGALLERLVTALSDTGRWNELQATHAQATQDLRRSRAALNCRTALAALKGVLEPLADAPLTGEALRAAKEVLRDGESPWKQVKKAGISVFTGTAEVALLRLLDDLDRLGLVAVREGELERLAPGLGVAKGPGWLPAALKARAHEGEPAQRHVARLFAGRP